MFDTRSRKERCPQPSYRSQALRPRLLRPPCSPPKRRGLRDVSISAAINFFSPTRRGIKVSDRARRRHHIGLATAQKHKFRCLRASRGLNRGWSQFFANNGARVDWQLICNARVAARARHTRRVAAAPTGAARAAEMHRNRPAGSRAHFWTTHTTRSNPRRHEHATDATTARRHRDESQRATREK